jgi:hypothetical protein
MILEILSPKKYAGVVDYKYRYFMPKMNHTIGFQEKTTIEKLAKVVVMTSTPGPT